MLAAGMNLGGVCDDFLANQAITSPPPKKKPCEGKTQQELDESSFFWQSLPFLGEVEQKKGCVRVEAELTLSHSAASFSKPFPPAFPRVLPISRSAR